MPRAGASLAPQCSEVTLLGESRAAAGQKQAMHRVRPHRYEQPCRICAGK